MKYGKIIVYVVTSVGQAIRSKGNDLRSTLHEKCENMQVAGRLLAM